MPTNAEVLGRVPLFADLSLTELAQVAARFREDQFPGEVFIFREGDVAARFWVVKEGQVKIVKYGEGGKEIVIEVITPGEVFGGAAMLMPYQPASAQAMRHAVTLSVSVDDYRSILREYPAVSVRVIEMLGGRLMGVIRMRMMISERVERRIAHILLKLATKFGEATSEGVLIRTSLSRQDIADLADTTIETAIRVMSKLRKEGLVKTLRGGYVLIVDQEALARIGGGVA